MPRHPRPLRPSALASTLALTLALVLPLSLFAETSAPSAPPTPTAQASVTAPASAAVPRLAPLALDDALKTARAHLAARPEESPDREIVGVQFIPPHGRPGPGFWLVDLAPYPADRPTPGRAFTSLLIGMDGKVEERGGRRPLDPRQTLDRDQRVATLHERMQDATSPAPSSTP